jgi:uncharacterized protein YbjT (DUF2867 family)
MSDPRPCVGQALGLTGPRSQEMEGVAEAYARALRRPVTYVHVPWKTWSEQVLAHAGLGSYVDGTSPLWPDSTARTGTTA